jgi:hypothetical protein
VAGPEVENDVATLSVLLVDDNRTFLRILTRFLSEYGEGALRVVGSLEGGRDAVAEAERLQPDVILVDLKMPDVPGLQLLPASPTLPDATPRAHAHGRRRVSRGRLGRRRGGVRVQSEPGVRPAPGDPAARVARASVRHDTE